MTPSIASSLSGLSLFRMAAVAAALVLSAQAASAQACPDWRQGGMTITTDGETAWVPQTYSVMAGGSLNLGACPNVQGTGFVSPGPSFTLTYDDRGLGRDLDFRVDAQGCDTVMLINDYSDTWHFNDDEDGTLNARLRLAAAPSGRYDIWVGTYGPQSCQVNLVVETFPPAAVGGSDQCPEWSLGGAEVRLNAGENATQQVVAGGGINLFERAAGCGVEGHGYVANAPDFTVYYEAPEANAELVMSVAAQCDTVLLINDLNAAWLFNDDTNGFDPVISIPAAASGRYDVWVGTFGSSLCEASITMASILPAAPGGGGTAPTK
jgi:hypothetical protein